ncbi:hypothetical protein [uncultured Microbacterium sp.]|uniref:hypothetical protein n=1 Tax=uncultured Microbacterium sp. TaxID=191216 RepID=UPI0025DC9A15|nr:hypothetical protein [uncultured Microbacterium sp.]
MAKIALKPYVLRDCTLNIKNGATDLGDYEGSVSKLELVPTTAVQTWKGLTPSAVYQDVAASEWVANIDFAQDFETPASLSQYLLANVGAKLTLTFKPKQSAGVKSASIVATGLPGSIGGAVGGFATSSVSLPCDGQPVLA